MQEFMFQFREWKEDDFNLNVWWLVWGEKIESEVRNECMKLGQEFEAANASRSLQYVWWAQPIKVDPYANISNNKVPPTNELLVKDQRIKVLWIGTSISNQSIDTVEIGKKTKTDITKEKMFTIIGDGKIKPHLNLQDQARSLVEKQGYSFVIIECGVNDISNAPAEHPKVILEEKLDSLREVVVDMKKPGMQVILVKPVQRIDSDQKEKLSQWFGKRLESFENIAGVSIEHLGIQAKNKWEERMLYGTRDGIHLAGERGSWLATHRAGLLLQRVLKRGETAQLPWWSASSKTRSQADIDRVKYHLILAFHYLSRSSGRTDLVECTREGHQSPD